MIYSGTHTQIELKTSKTGLQREIQTGDDSLRWRHRNGALPKWFAVDWSTPGGSSLSIGSGEWALQRAAGGSMIHPTPVARRRPRSRHTPAPCRGLARRRRPDDACPQPRPCPRRCPPSPDRGLARRHPPAPGRGPARRCPPAPVRGPARRLCLSHSWLPLRCAPLLLPLPHILPLSSFSPWQWRQG
jgi:hypothetical protein